jgi:arylsulfatase
MVQRYTAGSDQQAINTGYETPQLPLIFDLSSDPHEDFNLWSATLTMAWVLLPMLEIEKAYEKSIAEYPNIQPGEEFNGYPAK